VRRQVSHVLPRNEEYGLEILKVSEIIGMQPITRVPRMPEFVRGVINLRGKVIPITDLRMKFDMPMPKGATAHHRGADARRADGPRGRSRERSGGDCRPKEVEDAPAFGAGIRTEFLLGIGKTGGRVKLLLDIDRVLESTELAAIESAIVARRLIPATTRPSLTWAQPPLTASVLGEANSRRRTSNASWGCCTSTPASACVRARRGSCARAWRSGCARSG
jgi:purine-binding chemotaxis protein CheW